MYTIVHFFYNYKLEIFLSLCGLFMVHVSHLQKFGFPLGIVNPSISAAPVKMIWQHTILSPSTNTPSSLGVLTKK